MFFIRRGGLDGLCEDAASEVFVLFRVLVELCELCADALDEGEMVVYAEGRVGGCACVGRGGGGG